MLFDLMSKGHRRRVWVDVRRPVWPAVDVDVRVRKCNESPTTFSITPRCAALLICIAHCDRLVQTQRPYLKSSTELVFVPPSQSPPPS